MSNQSPVALYADVVDHAERSILDALNEFQRQIQTAESVDRALQLVERLNALSMHLDLTLRSALDKGDALCGSRAVCCVSASDHRRHFEKGRVIGRIDESHPGGES